MSRNNKNKTIRLKTPCVETPTLRNVGRGIIPGVYTLHRPDECYHVFKGKPIHLVPDRLHGVKNTIKVIENDLIREIVIPSADTADAPGIWPKREVQRLEKQSQVLTTKDRMAILEAEQEKRNKLAGESELRKHQLRLAQTKSTKNKNLNDVEMAEYKRTSHLLKRANDLKHENELDVQTANSLILATKCQAIRDAQIAEKILIKNQLAEEEARLLEMQEQQIAKDHREEMKRRQAKADQQAAYTKECLQQVREHEIQELFEMERRAEEARMQNRILLQQQKEADEKKNKKIQENRAAKAEVEKVNQELQQFHLIKMEEERIEDLRVREFLRKKQEREDAIEQEKRLVQEEKQKCRDRLYEMQRHVLTLQQTGDKLAAQRIQEEVERNWRAKEKEEAKKRQEMNERMQQEREVQMMDLKRMQALDMERDKVEFFKNIMVQKKLHAEEVDEQTKRHDSKMKYRAELLKQINEKEKERIEQRRLVFEEGIALRKKQEEKEKDLKDYIKSKVQKLRDVNFVPAHLVKDIERQLKL